MEVDTKMEPGLMMTEEEKRTQDDMEERLHFQKTINAFRSYRRNSTHNIQKREHYLNKLPTQHQKLLRKHGYQDNLDDLKQAVEKNFEIVNHILQDVDGIFENIDNHKNPAEMDARVKPTPVDMEKVQSTIKQIGIFNCPFY